MNVTQIQECILPCHNIITAFHISCLEQIKGARVSFSCFKNIPGRWGLGCMHFGDNLPISASQREVTQGLPFSLLFLLISLPK